MILRILLGKKWSRAQLAFNELLLSYFNLLLTSPIVIGRAMAWSIPVVQPEIHDSRIIFHPFLPPHDGGTGLTAMHRRRARSPRLVPLNLILRVQYVEELRAESLEVVLPRIWNDNDSVHVVARSAVFPQRRWEISPRAEPPLPNRWPPSDSPRYARRPPTPSTSVDHTQMTVSDFRRGHYSDGTWISPWTWIYGGGLVRGWGKPMCTEEREVFINLNWSRLQRWGRTCRRFYGIRDGSHCVSVERRS
jgi:hypothetical protein